MLERKQNVSPRKKRIRASKDVGARTGVDRKSPKARQAKSKARVAAYEDLFNQSTAGDVVRASIAIPPRRALAIWWSRPRASPRVRDRLLIDGLIKLPPGGIVGVIGANGAGKMTLFEDRGD